MDDRALTTPMKVNTMKHLLTTYLRAMYAEYRVPDDQPLLESDQREHEASISLFLSDPENTTAMDLHTAWVGRKEAQGWTFGQRHDAKRMTHPQALPWPRLRQYERDAEEAGIAALRAAYAKAPV
jgi:hypothetical protein